ALRVGRERLQPVEQAAEARVEHLHGGAPLRLQGDGLLAAAADGLEGLADALRGGRQVAQPFLGAGRVLAQALSGLSRELAQRVAMRLEALLPLRGQRAGEVADLGEVRLEGRVL